MNPLNTKKEKHIINNTGNWSGWLSHYLPFSKAKPK